MIRLNWLVLAVVGTLLVLVSGADAAPRHKRLKHKPVPKPPSGIGAVIKKEFPNGKITGSWQEDKGTELEVFVSFPNSPPIEVVFRKKSNQWNLVGFEYPVPAASLTPRAHAAVLKKYPKSKITEVELVFGAKWMFLGYQVTVVSGGKTHEIFVRANGVIAKDPL
jgi:hypothetical protein